MSTSNSLRWLVVAATAAMLLIVAAACAGETVEVPGETVVVEKEVIKEVQVPGETVVVEKEVIKEVMVPGETVTKEVVKEVEVPGETVVVKEEVVKTVEVPGQTVVVEKEVIKEVAGKAFVTDPTTGKVVSAPEYGGTLRVAANPGYLGGTTDIWKGQGVTHLCGVTELLSIGDWGLHRDDFDFMQRPLPLRVMKGQLAESWSQPDPLTIIWKIRQGVNWHNKVPMNGRELTAKDVEYNFHRYFALGSGFTEPAKQAPAADLPFESVTATDDWTVVMKLSRPRLDTLDVLTTGAGFNWYILGPEVIEQYGNHEDWRNVVGTGPWELTDKVEGSSMTFTKNPSYWNFDEKYPDNRLPYLDEFVFLAMGEEATRLAALRSGNIDYLGYSGDTFIRSIDKVEALRKTNPEIELIPYSYRSWVSYVIDISKPPFDDIRVRKAMQMAQDLETVNTLFYKGLAKATPQGVVGDGAVDFFVPFEEWPEEVKKGYVYDPEGAEMLLDEAGLPRGEDGIRFTAKATVNNATDITALSEIAASYWDAIGVDVEVEVPADAAAFSQAVREHNYDAHILSSIMGYDRNPNSVLRGMSHSDVTMNRYGDRGPEIDAIIEAAAAATTWEEMHRLVKEADAYLIENHYYIWYMKPPMFNAVQPWFVGYNGEYFLGYQVRWGQIFARLWIDSEMKKAYGY